LVELKKLQKDCGIPMPELIVRWVMADERINSVLMGSCQPHEVAQNVAGFQTGKLPPELHAAIDAIAHQFDA
jgi:aryl-alcohol dehydrogenase-like predicted oxidoreductase